VSAAEQRERLEDAGRILSGSVSPGPVLVITDANVALHWLAPLVSSLAEAGFEPSPEILEPGEASKTLSTVERLYGRLAGIGADRGSPVLGLGGGVVTDIAGFAAATWMRGIPWMAAPTTLLGMVDAAIGGKTGVNLPEGKNLVGAFHSPVRVISDPVTLSTLSPRHVRNGLAEVVKTGLVRSPALYERVREDVDGLLSLDSSAVRDVVSLSAAAKREVVLLDEREAGLRRILNLGHTTGHAIEAATGYGPVLHGEAVAVGLVTAVRLSIARGLATAELEEEVRDVLVSLGLPVRLGDLAVRPTREAMLGHLALDKKSRNGRLALVLLTGVGTPKIVEDGTAEEVLQAIPA
jgi:3-dehydroquinate synthase